MKKVEINRKQQKVTVSGYAEANKVLKKAKSTGEKAESRNMAICALQFGISDLLKGGNIISSNLSEIKLVRKSTNAGSQYIISCVGIHQVSMKRSNLVKRCYLEKLVAPAIFL